MKPIASLLILAPLALATTLIVKRPMAEAAGILMKAPAPELVGQQWINTPNGNPITLASRKGKVTIVQFWTFGCSNCRANLPAYAKWAKQWKDLDVEVIGVHTPELENERDPKNVAAEVKKLGIEYPVLIDGQGTNWNRYGTHYWPTVYVIDRRNVVRAKWEGELEYGGAGGTAQIESVVQKLLNQKP